MDPDSSNPRILLLHDEELSEIRQLLGDLAITFVERRGAPTEVDLRADWDLIIASQKRVSAFEGSEKTQKTRRIAVIDNDSRTLRALLRRMGVDYVVARPVHAAALRLLVLHCVYRGPERRRLSRVSIGAKVQVRTGLFRRSAILADLSLHGCRLVCDKPLKAGSKMKLFFPSEMGYGKEFNLPTRALRTAPAVGASAGEGHIVAGIFHGLSPAQGQRLRKVFEKYRDGPARLPEASRSQLQQGSGDDQPERRAVARKEYEKHVVAVSDEATRVLLCRDISIGGMRVEPNESLVPGDDLLIAVHVRSRAEPLIVNAQVSRDDGKSGMVLAFHNLSNESEDYLKKMVHLLPMLGVKSESADGVQTNMIISEIVERRAS
ncbi:MAG: PilZ domain-containing protein [bacterium]|nr:PilZ domain-containing protein [bacterium]